MLKNLFAVAMLISAGSAFAAEEQKPVAADEQKPAAVEEQAAPAAAAEEAKK